MNGVQTRLKCKPNVKRCKRFVFAAHSPLLHPNTLKTKAIIHFQTDHILTRFVFPPLKAYLFSSVHNRCLNYLEQLNVRNKYQEQILQKGDITGLLTWEYYVESELQEHIEKAINQLPPQCRKIFIMNRFNDKSIAQIAEELEISPRTVEKHIEVALKKLRQELSDYLPAGLLFWLLHL